VSRCFAALRQLCHLRCLVTNDCLRSLVISLVHFRLRQLRVCRTSCLSSTTSTDRTQRHSSLGISASSQRPRVWRTRDTALAASARTGQL